MARGTTFGVWAALALGGGCFGGAEVPPIPADETAPVDEEAAAAASDAWPKDTFEQHQGLWQAYREHGEAHAKLMEAGRQALAGFGEVPGSGVIVTYSKANWKQLETPALALRVLHPIPGGARALHAPPEERIPRVLQQVGDRAIVHYAHQTPEEGWASPTPIGLPAFLDALRADGGPSWQVLEPTKKAWRFPSEGEGAAFAVERAPSMDWLCPQMLGWRDAASGLLVMICGEEGRPIVYPTETGSLFLPFARMDAATRSEPEVPRHFIGLAVVLRRP